MKQNDLLHHPLLNNVMNNLFVSVRQKLGSLLLGIALLTTGSAVAKDQTENTVDLNQRFSAEQVLQLKVTLGPTEYMGKTVDGTRVNYPITGGTFEGKGGLKGTIVPGGADFSIEREDGTVIVSALYRIKTDDDQIIIIQNDGIWRPNQEGLARMAEGLEPLPSQVYARTTPVFRTQPGKYAWLNDYIFFGTIDTQDYGVLITIYKLN